MIISKFYIENSNKHDIRTITIDNNMIHNKSLTNLIWIHVNDT